MFPISYIFFKFQMGLKLVQSWVLVWFKKLYKKDSFYGLDVNFPNTLSIAQIFGKDMYSTTHQKSDF